jgi:hypothetical protein
MIPITQGSAYLPYETSRPQEVVLAWEWLTSFVEDPSSLSVSSFLLVLCFSSISSFQMCRPRRAQISASSDVEHSSLLLLASHVGGRAQHCGMAAFVDPVPIGVVMIGTHHDELCQYRNVLNERSVKERVVDGDGDIKMATRIM